MPPADPASPAEAAVEPDAGSGIPLSEIRLTVTIPEDPCAQTAACARELPATGTDAAALPPSALVLAFALIACGALLVSRDRSQRCVARALRSSPWRSRMRRSDASSR